MCQNYKAISPLKFGARRALLRTEISTLKSCAQQNRCSFDVALNILLHLHYIFYFLWLFVDLFYFFQTDKAANLSGFEIQGRSSSNQYLTKFKIRYKAYADASIQGYPTSQNLKVPANLRYSPRSRLFWLVTPCVVRSGKIAWRAKVLSTWAFEKFVIGTRTVHLCLET